MLMALTQPPGPVRGFGTASLSVVIRTYQASFELLLKDLLELIEFVEPADANAATFSHRSYALLLRACTDFESLARDLLVDSGSSKARREMTVLDYRGLENPWGLEACKVDFLLWRPTPIRMVPFQNWSSAQPPLSWYHDYNKVKHNRDAEFGLAKLKTLVEAVAALFCLIAKAANYDWGPMWSQTFRSGEGTFTRHPFEMTYPSNVVP